MFPEATRRNETRPSGDRQSEYHARALAELRCRASQQERRANQRWAKLDAQAVALQQRIATAAAKGDTRQADYARRALAAVVRGMGRLLASEPAAQSVGFPGEPWTKR